MGSRVVVYEPYPRDSHPTASMLLGRGFDLVPCAEGQALLEEVIQRRPDALVYAMSADCEQDLRLLQLIRRAAPDLPLVLLAADESIATRRQVLNLRPIYYTVWPAEAGELHEAVVAALVKSSRPRAVSQDRASGR
jgi:DNA-binding NarL/FixJ family response regulator